MSLTGGLDTRMIMAWQKSPPGALPCYTFGGIFRDCHDVLVARQVACMCGQPHEVIPVGETFLARFSHYANRAVYLSDACVDNNLTLMTMPTIPLEVTTRSLDLRFLSKESCCLARTR